MKSFDSVKYYAWNRLGKLLYGALFVAVLPVLIIFWGKGVDRSIRGFPAVGTQTIGWGRKQARRRTRA